METGRLWREVANKVAAEYPDVQIDHVLVDACGMYLVQNPERFDVIVTENTFGDILSDVAAGTCGGLGLAASASLGDGAPGLYEPVHGSAPDIAGEGIANPAATLRSVSLLLRYSGDASELADDLERAVDDALASTPTPDVGGSATTEEFADAVIGQLGRVTP
jgi:3-isopropylmalate dehydrogenase